MKNTLKVSAFAATLLLSSAAHAQSSGQVWTSGTVLTALQLQNLDNSKLNVNRLGAASGVAPLDALGAVRATAFANFDYTTIDPSTAAGRLLVPVPTVQCPGAMGTTSPSANCLAVRATAGNSVVGQMLSLVNEDSSDANLQVGQAIGVLQDSTTSETWGQNIVVTQGPGTAPVAGSEIDVNRAITCSVGVDEVNDSSCSGGVGSWVTGTNIAGTVGGPGYMVTQLSASGGNPLWDDGYGIYGASVRDTGFYDGSTSRAVVKGTGAHNVLGDCSSGVFHYGCLLMNDETSPSGLDGIAWTNTPTSGTNSPSLTADIHVQAHDLYFSSNYGLYQFSSRVDGQGTTDLEVGSPDTTLWANMDFHTGGGSTNDYDSRILATGGTAGTSGDGSLDLIASSIELSSTQTHVDGLLDLRGLLHLNNSTKAAILALASPLEGEIVNDSTDHVPVIYENGAWYPMTLGTALSN